MTARTKRKPASSRAARGRVAELRVFTDSSAERTRGGVQSIGRAFAIMEEIARKRDGIGLAELSKRVGLHNSTTFHLVKTMVSLGYVRQLKDNKRYRIGRPLFALAASALDEIEMMSVATPVLEDLSRQTGEAAHFSVRMGDAVVVLARTSGPGAFQLTDRVGVLRPAHCTALGKIMLAALAPNQFERFLQRAELKAYTPKSITAAEQLGREIAEVHPLPTRKPARLASFKNASGIAIARMPKAGSRTSSPGRLGRGPSPMTMRWSVTRNSWVATAAP